MTQFSVDVLDISSLSFRERLIASSLQGLVNRQGPRLFLDHGAYDEASSRKTNSVQMTEDAWFSKYREFLHKNDHENLHFYQQEYEITVHPLEDLDAALRKYRDSYKGIVVWDPELIETVNLALTLAGLNDLLVVHPGELKAIQQGLGLEVKEDLRGRFKDRIAAYQWAFENLFPQTKAGQVAQYEPTWNRAEYSDYIVKNKLFSFSLMAFEKGGLRDFGQKLLLLLVGGPIWLRNFLFDLRLDSLVRKLGLALLAKGSAETSLSWKILKSVKAKPYPTVFGWHCDRDDELAFMVAVSALGLRLAPTFLAGNFSFHSALPCDTAFKQHYLREDEVSLEDKTYLTFTLSDGDQFTLMNTAEVGNWRRPEHGKLPFNWEVQPLLVELAPALLAYYYRKLTKADMLVAGPSGAGYVIPPLVPDLPAYLAESARYCDAADIRITTSYTADAPRRVVREHGKADGNFLGFLAGYFHLGRYPMEVSHGRPFVSYRWPPVDKIILPSEEVLKGIKEIIDSPEPTPRFLACHLFAYATTLKDVYEFVQTLDPEKVKVVRADEFLLAAKKSMERGTTDG